MSFATGHTPPSGFVAGQLNDGASIGSFLLGNFSGNANAQFEIRLRFFNNKLIGLAQITKADGTVVSGENLAVKQREYFQNIYGITATDGPLTNKVAAFQSLIPLLATQAELAALGVNPDGQVPTNPTGGKIPYQQSADGIITAMSGAGVSPSPTTQTPLGSGLTSPTGTPTPTPDPSTGMKPWMKYALIGVGVLIIGYVVYAVMKMKKKKKK